MVNTEPGDHRLDLWLAVVGAVGVAAAVAVAMLATAALSEVQLLWALLLTPLAAVAERFTLHLTHKMAVNVGVAVYTAMVLLLPTGLPGVLAAIAIAVGQGSRRRRDPLELWFEVGQGALAATAAALVYAGLDRQAIGPDLAGVNLVAAGAAAVAFFVLNTGLVAVASALALASNPLKVWVAALGADVKEQAALAGLGLAATVVLIEQPVLLPILVFPLVLVHRAIGESVRLRMDTLDALAALVDVVELRDPYTAGHSRRVAATAHDLALRLGLTHQEADVLRAAGHVHDLGKVALDPAVLAKLDRLDDDDWRELRRHPGLGADVIARFAAFGDGHRVVRHHHERWDGLGYPDAISGETIPLGARIIAVADAFDALTSDRPYRAGMDDARAVRILEEGAGAQWDERVVAALVACVGVPAGAGSQVAPGSLPTGRTAHHPA